MAPHSSTLAWKIPWKEEPGRLQSMWSLRVGHDGATSLSLFPFMHWRRKWHPTPVFLPGKSHGWRSLVGCFPWGCKESDTSERLHFHFSLSCIVEGNGNPLQCSCLENPRDWGSWWATVYAVAQSRTRLKWLSSSSSIDQLEGFPGGSEVKANARNVGDPCSIPRSGRSPGEGNGNPLQYSCLGNPMDGEFWWATYSPWGHKESDMTDRPKEGYTN